jgi:ubiquinone/menaquinone biosynthesis C-methylase UbiE
MLGEVYRVLGPNGVYMMVSFGNPEGRMEYLKKKEF